MSIIFGTGGMARVLYSFVSRKHDVVAFTAHDNFVQPLEMLYGKPVIQWSKLSDYCYCGETIMMAIGYHEMNDIRAKQFDELCRKGWSVGGYVHKKIIHHTDVEMSSTCVIYDNVAIHAGSTIGRNVFISSNVSIGHDCKIGDHAWINSGVTLAGGVEVGERCVLGINSCVAQGVKLGAETFVSANAVVTQNTEAGAVVVAEVGKVIAMDSRRFIRLVGQP
jgi:sugar O-acyltransferase (sialic acid O-acetyltransferase NeuD family)